jgi:hypothetical protein
MPAVQPASFSSSSPFLARAPIIPGLVSAQHGPDSPAGCFFLPLTRERSSLDAGDVPGAPAIQCLLAFPARTSSPVAMPSSRHHLQYRSRAAPRVPTAGQGAAGFFALSGDTTPVQSRHSATCHRTELSSARVTRLPRTVKPRSTSGNHARKPPLPKLEKSSRPAIFPREPPCRAYK